MIALGTGWSGDMATFTFYIRDDRYSVPTLAIVNTNTEVAARVLATKRLLESMHHTAVDVYEGEDLRFSLTLGEGDRRLQ
ncbi:MAG: hypothetical protein JWO83_1537 [Caulobacteraceae bacterium]|nr:hypothetical protein [Caulobacteraceae bacterium]